MSYRRVIPRDLFNEAKLLKCLGRLVLKIHDGMLPDLTFSHDDDGEAFDIEQGECGELEVTNLHFFTGKGIQVYFHTTYNSKMDYPLLGNIGWDEAYVFDDNGELTTEFKDLIK